MPTVLCPSVTFLDPGGSCERGTLIACPSVVVLIRRLINEPFDLEHGCRQEGRQDEEAQNSYKGAILNSWVHPDERDQQQGRDAKGDRRKDRDWVGGSLSLDGW